MIKVGDWVRWLNMSSSKTFKIDKFDGERYHLENEIHWVKPIELKLWEPQAGEWCWFWNNETASATLNRFITSYGKDANETFSAEVYKHCEPFIGELPSFIKDIL